MSSMTAKEPRTTTMIATLGTEPQVVTIALDTLLDMGKQIREVTVIYTGSPAVRESLQILKDELDSWQAYSQILFRCVPVAIKHKVVKDFQTEEELGGLLRTFYTEIRRARQAKQPVHLCLSGGRKIMGLIGMSVAQLLFGPEDRAWYLITEGWQPGASRRLHASKTDRIWLVPVPVLRWNEAGTLLQAVTELKDPREVLIWYERLTRKAEERRKGEFIRRWLTPAESKVTRLACRGFDNATIAARLDKQEQTVANQLHGVYEKLREWLGFPSYNVDRNVLIAQFAPYFAFMEMEEHY
jgi:CRISPR-associated protein Csx14